MRGSRIAAVMGKEVREIVRDPIIVWIALALPLVMLFLFGYAINLDVEDVALGMLDQDKTPASRSLIDRFVQSGYFRLAGYYAAASEPEAALQEGRVRLALVIPPRFHAELVRDGGPAVQLLVDGTYSSTALIVTNYARTIVAAFEHGTEAGEAARRAPVQVETRIWYSVSHMDQIQNPTCWKNPVASFGERVCKAWEIAS